MHQIRLNRNRINRVLEPCLTGVTAKMKEINLKAIPKGLCCTSFLETMYPISFILRQLIELRMDWREEESRGALAPTHFSILTFTFEIAPLRLNKILSFVCLFVCSIWPSLLVFSMLDHFSLSSSLLQPTLPPLLFCLRFLQLLSFSIWVQISSPTTLHLPVL